MAQFNIDIDSGSQLIYGDCPGMSQATLFSRVFVVPALIREGLIPSEIGAVYTFDLCHVLPSRAQLLVNALPADCHPPELSPSSDTVTI